MAEAVQNTPAGEAAIHAEKTYTRFSLLERIQHLILLLSFSILGLTGLPQKYANTGWGETLLAWLGGIETTRRIHHWAAIVLMAVSIVHIVAVLYRIFVQRSPLTMLPLPSDFIHLWQDVLYYLGRRARKAYYGRYNYAEKAEYFAVVWGTAIMTLTGFMMWNPIATTRLLPGEYIPAAKAAHGGEALLAVLAIILWHFYHVHIKLFNKSMFTGKLTAEEMEEEHPGELAQIKAGQVPPLPPPAVRRKRELIFFPIAAVIAVGLGFSLYRFTTFEQTAIAFVPNPETAPVFVPITPTPTATVFVPPTPTPVPTSAGAQAAAFASWEDGISQLLNARCGACHVQSQLSGLSLATYGSTLDGGSKGPAVVPGNPDQSVLVQVQQAGGHPGQLTAEELQGVIAWIQAGAPEGAAAASAWTSGVSQLLNTRCGACHVQAQTGGLSLATYQDALKGGSKGPAVAPGNPEGSLLVQVQQAGGHPGQLSPEELQSIVAWIQAGAPENPAGGGAAAGATPASGTAAPGTVVPGTAIPGGTPGVGAAAGVTAPITWDGAIGQLFTTRCGACHVQTQTGGLSLATYQDALKGGSKGPAVIPNNPEESVIVQVQQAGNHPGQLTVDELAQVIGWIEVGAPEK